MAEIKHTTKNIISNKPDYANLQQVLEALRGKLGIDENGVLWLCGKKVMTIEEPEE